MGICLGISSFGASAQANKPELPDISKHIKINQVQVLGTHNSYAQPVDPSVMSYVGSQIDKAKGGYLEAMSAEQLAFYKEYHPNEVSMEEGLKYDHPAFPEQLDAGLRSLEMDVYHDPTGGRFSHPAAYKLLREKGIAGLAPHDTEGLDKPGFKVLHIADFDFRSHYPTFKGALEALKKWSDDNPGHIPLYIMIEAKDSGMPIFSDAAEVLKFDEKAFDALDAQVQDVLGREKIITPDDVRREYRTLREAVLANNWPTVDESRGKFIFLLLPSAAGAGQEKTPYLLHRPNLEGRLMFVQSKPEDTYGAFLLLDNAITRLEEIKAYVKQGYLVRTRSDIETYEAKVNDHTRAEAAFSSGAQVISTDFFRKGNTYHTDYFVELPGGNPARLNPINSR